MRMSLEEHLSELRKRISLVLISIILFALLSYLIYDEIVRFLAKPIGKLVFTKPQEGFVTRVEVSLYLGILSSIPVFLYQLWKFLSPGLLTKERRYLFYGIIGSFTLFFAGILFSFYMILPICIKFLLSYENDLIKPLISLNSYVSFVLYFVISFGIVFQLPILIIGLVKIGIIKRDHLVKNRRYVILSIFVFSAILTPPDVVSQFLMAVPALLLYEISILISKKI